MKRFKIISILICLLLVVPCMGATIIVDANTANPLANFHNIKDAIGYANDDDVIVVAPETYTGANNRDLDFLGKAITLMSTNPNDPDIVATTIIDCQELGCGFLFLSGEDTNSIVDGFTITNGKGDFGGGMRIENSSPTVRNCIFSGNIGNYVGGGIYCNQSSPTVKSCTFSENSCTYDGGGMANFFGASPNVSNCIFINNLARSGGGMCNRKSSTNSKVTNCTFIDNSATQFGGGIFNSEWANSNVTNCTIVANSAGSGGGVYNYYHGASTIVNCIIWDNNPDEIPSYSPNFTVSYCDVKGGYPGGTNIINLAPLFVDPSSGDYHLLPDSPCIDAGDPCGVYTGQTDIDGEQRVFGDYVDMGSDEAWPVDILTFIDEAVSEQTLWGTGPGKSAEGRLGALRNMVETAENLIEAELFQEGCQQLRDAYRRTDGELVPSDFVSGPAAPELAGMIEDLMLDLGCE